LVSLPTTVRVLPFIAADALSAACLFRASRLLEQVRLCAPEAQSTAETPGVAQTGNVQAERDGLRASVSVEPLQRFCMYRVRSSRLLQYLL
jgi:hypothetical protein